MMMINLSYMRLVLVWVLGILFSTHQALALDIYGRDAKNGGQGSSEGLVGLYQFDDISGGVVKDTSNVGTALNLTIEDTSKVKAGYDLIADPDLGSRKATYLSIEQETLIRSQGAATKIIDQCKSSNELTVEAWLKNDRDDQPRRLTPLRIVTLSKRSDDTNFFIGYEYDQAAEFAASVRVRDHRTNGREESSNGMLRTQDSTTNRVLEKDLFQHVVFTRNSAGEGRLYVSRSGDNPNELIPIQRQQGGANAFGGNFGGWGEDLVLGFGNEISHNDKTAPRISNNSSLTTENRGWRGQLYLVAIYCKAHSPEDILGEGAPNQRFKQIQPNLTLNITPYHTQASLLYRRLVGVKTPIDDPVIQEMATHIAANDWLQAASVATKEDNFLNITVRDFAKRMSNRDETVSVPLNDFAATVIGVTRDDLSAQQLLTGNFYYMGDPTKAAVVNDPIRDLLRSNNHYEALESGGYNLAKTLVRKSGQLLYNGSGGVEPHREPAGVITSRSFMEAHATAGTNRRIVEYLFREFLCVPISTWANSQGPDEYVGRDVDRFPGGDHAKFLTTCRSCHSNMDAFRGATAKFNFADGFVKHADVLPATNQENNENEGNMFQNPAGIAGKMNRNSDMFPQGRVTIDNTWTNYASLGKNEKLFGWPATEKGQGLRPLGEMVSKSQQFPRCMATRVFRSVCKREPASYESTTIQQLASAFQQDNYNLRLLFARTATTPECLGKR